MSISELGSLGEFVSSIVVVFTLIYLIYQVRQNTISIRSQSRYHILESLNSDMKNNLQPDFQRVMSEAGDSGTDKVILNWYWLSMLSHLELLYFEVEDGALPKTFRATLKFRVATMFTFAESALYWKANRNLFTPVFQTYVDTQLPHVDDILATDSMDFDNPYDFVAAYLKNKGSS